MRSLCIVVVIDVLGFGILIPLIPYMAARFGASPSPNTAVLGTYSLCQLLAAPLWGRMSDRYGRRPILLSSMSGAFVSYLILAFAHTLTVLFIARALAGFMAGNRGAVMGVCQTGTSTARVIAPFLSGPVYMLLGPGFPYLLACLVTLQAFWCILGLGALPACSRLPLQFRASAAGRVEARASRESVSKRTWESG